MKLSRFALGAVALLLPALAAAQALSPTLTADDARHLLVRTGFAALPAEIAKLQGLTRAEAVRRILAGTRTEAATPAPAWTKEEPNLRPPGRMASEALFASISGRRSSAYFFERSASSGTSSKSGSA